MSITYPMKRIKGDSFTDWKLFTSPVAMRTYPSIIVNTPIPKIR